MQACCKTTSWTYLETRNEKQQKLHRCSWFAYVSNRNLELPQKPYEHRLKATVLDCINFPSQRPPIIKLPGSSTSQHTSTVLFLTQALGYNILHSITVRDLGRIATFGQSVEILLNKADGQCL